MAKQWTTVDYSPVLYKENTLTEVPCHEDSIGKSKYLTLLWSLRQAEVGTSH